MANHKSSEKRARQDAKINARNTATEKAVRTWEKKVRAAIAKKDEGDARKMLSLYTSKMGKAAAKGVVKKQNAARKVSRLSSLLDSSFSK